MLRKVALVAGVLAGMAGSAAAQSTATPVYQAPYRAFERNEIGASLSDPGQGYALEGFYRLGRARYDLGFRAGFADPDGGDTAFLLGVDFRTRVVEHSEDFPFDGALILGVGGAFADNASQAFIPVGLSLGRRLELDDSRTSFVPYLQPTLTPTFGDGDSDLLFSLGFGADVRVGRALDLRVSAGIGDLDGVSVSLSFLR